MAVQDLRKNTGGMFSKGIVEQGIFLPVAFQGGLGEK